jgi:hydroxymethylpyrimidine pyrophosphatase-like HAD family hydrolase
MVFQKGSRASIPVEGPGVAGTFSGRPFLLSDGAAVCVLSDYDGTISDETLPEPERLSSCGPAKEAFATLGAYGVPTGLITSRSIGEVIHLMGYLGINGPSIAEDGAVILLDLADYDHINSNLLAVQGATGTQLTLEKGERTALVRLGSVDLTQVESYFTAVRKDLTNRGLSDTLLTSLDTIEDVWKQVPHATIDDAKRSALRLASAYVVHPTDVVVEILKGQAEFHGVRVHGRGCPNIMPRNISKGDGLRVLAELLKQCGWANNLRPIILGNGPNDVPVLKQALELGGWSVLVAEKGNPPSYQVPTQDIPEGVMVQTKPHGFGVAAALAEIQKQFEKSSIV